MGIFRKSPVTQCEVCAKNALKKYKLVANSMGNWRLKERTWFGWWDAFSSDFYDQYYRREFFQKYRKDAVDYLIRKGIIGSEDDLL